MNVTAASYKIGDMAGVRIHKVDRTNTDANLIPCKVHEVLQKPGRVMYKLYSQHGMITTMFTADDLGNMPMCGSLHWKIPFLLLWLIFP